MIAAVLAELERVRGTVVGWCDVDRSGWSSADRSAALAAMIEVRERDEAAVLHAVADWIDDGAWAADGSLTPAQWLRTNTSTGRSEARQLVLAASLVRHNTGAAKALASGDVTAAHLVALARQVTSPRIEQFDEHADVLLDGARTLDVDGTTAMARRWAAYADDEANRGEPAHLHGRRGVWLHKVGDLTEAHVRGAAEDLAVLRAVLDRLEPPDRSDTCGGPRSLAQRRYDAPLAGEFDPRGRSDIAGWSSVLPSRVRRLLCNSWISRVASGLPACRAHHVLIHEGWTPVRDDDGTWRLEPP